MSTGILLDTSALIHLYDEEEDCHDTAKRYYLAAVGSKIPLWLSTVAVAEYQAKGVLPKSLLEFGRVLPFGFDHALKAGEFRAQLRPDSGDRPYVSDDLKLIAQAAVEEIPLILTDDKKTLAKYAARLQSAGKSEVQIRLLRDGFNAAALSAAAG